MKTMESAEGSLLVWHEKIGEDEWRLRMEHGPRQSYSEWTNVWLTWDPKAKVANIALFDRPWWARGPLAHFWRRRISRRISSGWFKKITH